MTAEEFLAFAEQHPDKRFDFIDGDDLHSPSNIAKMARGEPLTDDDRAPWLKEVGLALRHHEKPLIIGCSALKRRYRDQIRAAAGRPSKAGSKPATAGSSRGSSTGSPE